VEKLDLRSGLKHLYSPSAREVSLVDVPPMNFLMVDGAGDPNVSPEYQQAIELLYTLSYTLKFVVRQRTGIDYTVMPLEGLWWVEDADHPWLEDKSRWKWIAMLMQPDVVTETLVAEAMDEVRAKKGLAVERVRFETYHEGLSAQILHIGPYAAEALTIARLHRFIQDNGYEPAGKHHEIYISDPRRTAPDKKLKTVLRQPIRKRG